MNGSIRPTVTSRPLAAPPALPIARPATMPSPTAPQPPPSEGTRLLMMMIISPAMKAAIEPTDRSRPPEVITKVAPMAIRPMNDERATMLDEVAERQEIAVEQRAEDHQQQQRQQWPEHAQPEARAARCRAQKRRRRWSCCLSPRDAHLVTHDLLLVDLGALELADDPPVPASPPRDG